MANNMSDWLENRLIDYLFRGQTFAAPTTVYFALFTVTPTDAGGGTEVSGGSYARVGVACSLANFAGTQSAGSTVASSGTNGTTSNNGTITFAAPTANWGSVVGMAAMDALTGGNMLVWCPLTAAKTVNNLDAAPSFAAGIFTYQIDA